MLYELMPAAAAATSAMLGASSFRISLYVDSLARLRDVS